MILLSVYLCFVCLYGMSVRAGWHQALWVLGYVAFLVSSIRNTRFLISIGKAIEAGDTKLLHTKGLF